MFIIRLQKLLEGSLQLLSFQDVVTSTRLETETGELTLGMAAIHRGVKAAGVGVDGHVGGRGTQ